MKLRLFLTALLLTVITCPLVRADGGDTRLEKEMKTMNRAFKQLKQQVADASKNASSLTLLAQIERSANASVTLIPQNAADLPEKDRVTFIASYKAKMKDFIAALEKLEAALKAGDNAGATKLLTELNNLQRADHREFRKPQD